MQFLCKSFVWKIRVVIRNNLKNFKNVFLRELSSFFLNLNLAINFRTRWKNITNAVYIVPFEIISRNTIPERYDQSPLSFLQAKRTHSL